MGIIFDDISSDEMENYYEEFINIDPRELYIYDNQKKDYKYKNESISDSGSRGVLLSYGESNGLMTVGAFMVAGYIDRYGNETNEADAYEDGFVILKQIHINERLVADIEENAGQIIMPYKSFIKAGSIIKHNVSQLELLSSQDKLDTELVLMVHDSVGDILANQPEKKEITDLDLKGISLTEAEAIYTGENGMETGNNYTMFPFEIEPKINNALRYIIYDDPNIKTEPGMEELNYFEGDYNHLQNGGNQRSLSK